MKALIAFVCLAVATAGCSKRPGTLISQYDKPQKGRAIAKAKASVDEFLAVLEKKGADEFAVKAPIKDAHGTEHFWITDVTYERGVFTGKIGNDPGIVKNVQVGQTWKVKKDQISDWM